jgi:hypothetical protein
MIENKVLVEPHVDHMRILGASQSRGLLEKIGQFGSGFPNALAVLARSNILHMVRLYIGTTCYMFGVEKLESGIEEIYMKKVGGTKINLNIDINFGVIHWNNETMAVREFISNACDGSEGVTGDYSTVKLVKDIEDGDFRAKAGHVRVYIPMNWLIEEYVEHIKINFICLRSSYDPNISIMDNKFPDQLLRVYRKGVIIGDHYRRSLFTYNSADIKVNECRTIDSADCRSMVTTIIQNAPENFLKRFLQALKDNQEYFELDYQTIVGIYPDEEEREVWKLAINSIFGDDILCSSQASALRVAEKGYGTFVVTDCRYALLKRAGMCTANEVLSEEENAGITILSTPPSPALSKTFDKIWGILKSNNFTHNKNKPELKIFSHQGSDTSTTKGFYKNNVVYINSHDDSDNLSSYHTVLHEVAHHITGAQDYTQCFQEWSYQVAAHIIKELV